MLYDDEPDFYEREARYWRHDNQRRRSSPSLIDAIDVRQLRRPRRTQSNWALPQQHQYRGYDDERRQARPSRINYDDDDDDDDFWARPDRDGQRTRGHAEQFRRDPPRSSVPRQQLQRQISPSLRNYFDDVVNDSRDWESAKTRQAPLRQRREESDISRYGTRDDSRTIKNHQPRGRQDDNYYGDAEPRRNERHHFAEQESPPRANPARGRDRELSPDRFERQQRNYDDSQSDLATDSDALSVFAHIRTESDSRSSGNHDNFDEDQDDMVRSPTPIREDPKPKPKPKPKPISKPKKPQSKPTKPARLKQQTPKQQAPPEPNPGSGSSFTMGSSQVSVEIEAIPPPGPQVDANDATAVAAMLWTVDYLDRFSLGLTVALSVIVVTALVTAMAAHQPVLYVVVGMYAILWFIIHRESRALQEQMRNAHSHHAAMNAVELAEVDVIAVARRTIQTTALKLVRVIQVSAGGSIVFLVLLAGLAIWSGAWAAFGLSVVVVTMSGATIAMATVQCRNVVNTTDRMMSEGIT